MITRLLASSATWVMAMTGLLSPVALFRPGTIHVYAIGQAGPSIWSSEAERTAERAPPPEAAGAATGSGSTPIDTASGSRLHEAGSVREGTARRSGTSGELLAARRPAGSKPGARRTRGTPAPHRSVLRRRAGHTRPRRRTG